MATAAFLKELRRKHHLGEFRRGAKSHKTVVHSKRGVVMARKRRGSFKKGGMFGSGLMGNVLGVGGYVFLVETVAEPLLAQFIPNQYLDIAELVAGAYFMNKGGIIGNIAKAAVTINTYSLMKKYVSPAVVSTTNSLFQS